MGERVSGLGFRVLGVKSLRLRIRGFGVLGSRVLGFRTNDFGV